MTPLLWAPATLAAPLRPSRTCGRARCGPSVAREPLIFAQTKTAQVIMMNNSWFARGKLQRPGTGQQRRASGSRLQIFGSVSGALTKTANFSEHHCAVPACQASSASHSVPFARPSHMHSLVHSFNAHSMRPSQTCTRSSLRTRL